MSLFSTFQSSDRVESVPGLRTPVILWRYRKCIQMEKGESVWTVIGAAGQPGDDDLDPRLF